MYKRKNIVLIVLFVIALICSATDSVAASDDSGEGYFVTVDAPDADSDGDLISIPQTADLSYVFYAMSLISAGCCLILVRSGRKK